MREFSKCSKPQPETPNEVLAHHAARADLVDKAIDYWQKAGSALEKSAYVEAAGFLHNALGLIQAQPADIDRGGLELQLQLRLGLCNSAMHGFGAKDTVRAFARANELRGAPETRHVD